MATCLVKITSYYFHSSRFAGTVWSQKTDDLTVIHFEGNIVYSFLLTINFEKIFYFDRHNGWANLVHFICPHSPLLRSLNPQFHNTETICSCNSLIPLQ